MEINYWAVLACAIASMVLGMLWYGAIFSKKWMEIIGVDPNDKEAQKEMGKGVGLLYLTSFVLAFFQAYVLAHYIAGWKEASGIENAMWIWAAFIIPTLAGSCMWTNEPGKKSWARFLIQAGYQLLLFIIFALILSQWK